MDGEVLAAVAAHLAQRHQRALEPGTVVVQERGRVARGVVATVVAETDASPAWFSCRLCREGRRRFRVDLFAQPTQPPLRHVRAIGRHFAEAHGMSVLAEGAIYRGPVGADQALCSYEPSRAARGAGIRCRLCPEGFGRIVLEEPAFGDADRLAWLLGRRPELYREIGGLGPVAAARRLEAIDRGVVPVVQQAAVERALRRAQKPPQAREPGAVDQALAGILRERARAGGITAAIRALVGLMDEDPLGYVRLVAEHIPQMRPYLHLDDVQLAGQLAFHGRVIRRERSLWGIWHTATATG